MCPAPGAAAAGVAGGWEAVALGGLCDAFRDRTVGQCLRQQRAHLSAGELQPAVAYLKEIHCLPLTRGFVSPRTLPLRGK